MKKNITISIDIDVLVKCKAKQLCISHECEIALRNRCAMKNIEGQKSSRNDPNKIWSPKLMRMIPLPR